MSSTYQYNQLIMAYENAHKEQGVYAHVYRNNVPRFQQKEVELRKEGISPRKYANFVVLAYLGWCLSKGMGVVPINIFLGPAAMRRYLSELEDIGRDDVGSMDVTPFLVQCEAMVAAAYIHATLEGSTVSERHVAELLRAGLPDTWWYARKNGYLEDSKKEILDTFRAVYRLNGVELRSYNDVVVALLSRDA